MMRIEELRYIYGKYAAREALKLEDGETRNFYPSAYQHFTIKAIYTSEGVLYEVNKQNTWEELIELLKKFGW